MKRVDIFQIKDFEKLENLTGNDSIFLKIHKEFRPSKISAISLKNFYGAITIDVESKGYFSVFKVYGNNKKNMLYFFEDTKNTNLFINERDVSFFYFENQREYDVKNEKEFQKIFSKENNEKTLIHLKNDLVLKQVNFERKCIIDGENHRLFIEKELFQRVPFVYKNVELILVDKVFYINRKEDLLRLENLTHETVVASFRNSLMDLEFRSISLKDFTGTLYLLGNNYSIIDSIVKSNTKCLGLFSVIHPYGNLYIENLNLKNVKLIGEFATTVGCFLGRKKSFENLYQSVLGVTSIENSNIEQIEIYCKNYMFLNPYVGYIKENLEIINSSCSNIKVNSNKISDDFNYQDIYNYFSGEKGFYKTEGVTLKLKK